MSNANTAKVNPASSTSRRRSKKSQQVKLNNTVTIDSVGTQEEQNLNTDKGAQVIAMPVQVKSLETLKQESFQISQPMPLPGNRPIDAGNLQVLGTISVMGERPIFASSMKIWDTISVSGERPIASSSLQVSETAMIMGNRPIASNYIDGAQDLMGYLD